VDYTSRTSLDLLSAGLRGVILGRVSRGIQENQNGGRSLDWEVSEAVIALGVLQREIDGKQSTAG
jgi:hypothetical protein